MDKPALRHQLLQSDRHKLHQQGKHGWHFPPSHPSTHNHVVSFKELHERARGCKPGTTNNKVVAHESAGELHVDFCATAMTPTNNTTMMPTKDRSANRQGLTAMPSQTCGELSPRDSRA
jgi:hypothetical protein